MAPAHDPPSEAECDALFTHALAVTFAALPRPASDGDQAIVRGELRPQFVADCRAGTRAYHRCGLAAKSVAELAACGQATRKSSTSNTRVELGGITFANPRLP